MKAVYEALELPEVSGAEALLGNRVYGRSGKVRLDVEGKRYRIAFLPGFADAYRPALRLVLSAGDRRASLDMETLPLPELLGYPEGIDPGQLPAEVLRAYLEGVLGDLLDRAGRLLGRPLGVLEAGLADGEDWAAGTDRTLHLTLEAEEGQVPERLRARLHLANEEFSSLAEALPPAEPDPEEWRGLPLALRYRVGTAALTVAECEALGPGDIILLADDPLAKGALRLCAGDKDMPLWTATWIDGKVSLEEEYTVDAANGNPGAQGGAPDMLEALEVQITFDLGSRMATLAEIRGLAAGAVLALPENPDARVGIRVGGKSIGSGSLIMLDGRAGVRVESLWKGEGP
jgi:type III secretion protein Q